MQSWRLQINLNQGCTTTYVTVVYLGAFVKIESIQKFADGGQVRLGSSKAKYSPDEIVRRAKSRLGEKKYGLIGNNCEQFVNWCRTGDHKSKQVNRAALAIGYLSPFVGAAVYLKQKLGGPKQR